MYKGALVGCGSVACRAHVPAWRHAKAGQIVAAVDPNAERLAEIRTLLPGVRCYEHIDALLDQETLDFLDICTPPAMHDAIVRRACTQGLHVLCEKPLTVSAEGLQALLTTVATTKRVVFPVHNWKYAPLFQTLKQLVEADEIGRPTYIELTTLRTRPAGLSGWRLDPKIAGGGILMDHGWHALYLLLFLLGDTPHSIRASIATRRFPSTVVEDTATCDLTFPTAQARLHLTWAASQRRSHGLIRGDKGEIHLEDAYLVVHRHGQVPQEIPLPEALSARSYHPDWFAALLPDFFAAMAVPQPQHPALYEAATCLRLILLAYCSAAQNARTLSCAEIA